MHHLERWSANEALLQSYRSIFISSQSFLLTAGAVLTGKSPTLLFVVAGAALVMIWLVWFPVVRAPLRIVDYHKYAAALASEALANLCSEHQYVHDPSSRIKANALLGIATNWRATRVKMDILLPILFSALWVALVAHERSSA